MASTDCADDVFWSAWSASEVSAEVISMSLPSTPPASLMSFCASFMVAILAGPRYAMEPVSGNRPAAMNVPESDVDEADESLELDEDEPQPDSIIVSAAAAAVIVIRVFLELLFFIIVTSSCLCTVVYCRDYCRGKARIRKFLRIPRLRYLELCGFLRLRPDGDRVSYVCRPPSQPTVSRSERRRTGCGRRPACCRRRRCRRRCSRSSDHCSC